MIRKCSRLLPKAALAAAPAPISNTVTTTQAPIWAANPDLDVMSLSLAFQASRTPPVANPSATAPAIEEAIVSDFGDRNAQRGAVIAKCQ